MKKFKKFSLLSAIIVIGVLAFTGYGLTTPFPNPDPSSFGNDLDDLGIFTYSDAVTTVEIFDLGDFTSGVGSIFGFFFQGTDINDPANTFTIFDPSDTTVTTPSQIAVIDFLSGIVLDVDDGSNPSVQDTFTGTGNIGFFLTPDPIYGLGTLYTIPSLNQGGEDLAGTFPMLGPPSDDFLIGFYNNNEPIGLEYCLNVTPVPEPCTFLLFFLPLIGLIGFRKRFM